MSKRERQYPFDFGRVFFPGEASAIPAEIRLQPLRNHVDNVIELVRKWNENNFPCESSFDRVLEAAKVHDIGKPQKFEIQAKTKQGKFKEYTYSFRGHRYLAKSDKDAWAEALAIGHHDFSVKDICSAVYELKKKDKYKDILTQEPLAYARELYILEMCDQIEAELACRIFDDGKQAESRTFMDFTITPDESDPTIYFIDPWDFKELTPIKLNFKSWVMRPTEFDTDAKLHQCIKDGREEALGKTLDNIVKDWWKSQQGQPQESISKTITLKPYPSAIKSKTWTAKEFYQELAGFTPNPMQEEMYEAVYDLDGDKHPAILLKAPTGSGKFESVLLPALASNYRLILPLPARSLLEDQKQRTEEYLKRFSQIHKNREISLLVDTGSQMYRWVYKNGNEIKTHTLNPRRHLYKGDVILTTLDKFLYRYFAFGDKQKSFTFPLRIHREKTLICFDEAHSYDEISFTNFHSLVKSLYEAGRSLILMTATMPKEHTERFDYLDIIDYVDEVKKDEKLQQFQHQKNFEWINNFTRDSEQIETFHNKFAEIILKEWKAKANRRIIAVVERVKDAVAIYQQIKNALNINTSEQERYLFLYHGRLADQIRPITYQQLQQRDLNNQSYILVTTSAIEVGCDLNAEVLISEICPPENLIQRAGRCNRKGNIPNAKVLVVGNAIPDFINTLDESGWQEYQNKLQNLKEFNTHEIAQCISRSEQVDDYRIVELFSMLHDYVYNADLTCKPAHDKGLVITRSWQPSVTLIYQDESQDSPKITVPIDRLIKNKNNAEYANTYVYERSYNQETTRWEMRDLGWGNAYSKDIVIEIYKNNDGAGIYEDKPEYSYNHELGFVELPGMFIKLKTNDLDEKLLYQNTDKKSAIITYTKAINNEQFS